ncbi:hypothetical protein RR48_03469 [Papilio machaon]|uniref:EGF-like domain-containing protein n=1 Tax=Papilio machaon TaxID=76193 RepID=A0A0N0PB33_PAPMA|nr:hypothetical protein RR48_03469 [Papilio machaon]
MCNVCEQTEAECGATACGCGSSARAPASRARALAHTGSAALSRDIFKSMFRCRKINALRAVRNLIEFRRSERGRCAASPRSRPQWGLRCAGLCGAGGRCVRAGGGVCACPAGRGGAHCQRYVGHDSACAALSCPPRALCAWRPDDDPLGPGEAFCACEGEGCEAGGAGAGAGGGAWLGGALALLTLLTLFLAALYLVHRRRRGAFLHARLADNVEINNPMYLAGEDEPELRPAHDANGGNHFANPVYESIYSPQDAHPTEERANLLQEGSPARL